MILVAYEPAIPRTRARIAAGALPRGQPALALSYPPALQAFQVQVPVRPQAAS
jgi:hypothetical protein